MLPFNVELFDLAQDPSEKNNLTAQHPDEKPLFLVDQFKVITKNMQGEPVLPTDEDFAGVEQP